MGWYLECFISSYLEIGPTCRPRMLYFIVYIEIRPTCRPRMLYFIVFRNSCLNVGCAIILENLGSADIVTQEPIYQFLTLRWHSKHISLNYIYTDNRIPISKYLTDTILNIGIVIAAKFNQLEVLHCIGCVCNASHKGYAGFLKF